MIKNKSTINQFGIVIFFVLISLFFFDSLILFPIKLFIIFFHEISHVIAGIVSGGRINFLTFDLNLSGKTSIDGGSSLFIASSGYLGSLIIGSLIFISAFSNRLKKWYFNILALITFITSTNLVKGDLQIFLGIIVSILLFLIPRYVPEKFANPFLQYLGLISCMYITTDIKEDLLTQTIRETDTQILEFLTGISANLWGLLWFVISIFVVIFLLRYSFKYSKN
ncbi:MAG: M50 family metallopeptidase [Ignavibacteriae bacterium]|nr:M50 family metallopeptidase [Ignavibacteriota bacterium]